MRRSYEEIDDLIINFTIDYLQENDKNILYNELICQNINITRHVLYNHFENISNIYNSIEEKAKDIINKFEIVELPTKEYLVYSIRFIYENKKLLEAAFKINPVFFNQYHTIMQKKLHEKFLELDNIPNKIYIEAFQISGFLGIIKEIKNVESEEQLQEIINCVLFIYKITNDYFKSKVDSKS